MQRVIAALDGRPELTLARRAGEARLGPADLVAGRAAARRGDLERRAAAGHRRHARPAEHRAARLRAPRRGPDPPVGPAELRGAAAAARSAAGSAAARARRPEAGCARRWRSCLDRFDAVVRPAWRAWRRRSFTPTSTGRTCSPTAAGSPASSTSATRWPGRSRWTSGVAACYQLGAGGPAAGDLLAPALDVVGRLPRGRPASRRRPGPGRPSSWWPGSRRGSS